MYFALFSLITFFFFFRMWFHRSFRADDWLLFVVSVSCYLFSHLEVLFPLCKSKNTDNTSVFLQIVSPVASKARGFVSGEMFNTKGEVLHM